MDHPFSKAELASGIVVAFGVMAITGWYPLMSTSSAPFSGLRANEGQYVPCTAPVPTLKQVA